MHKLIPGVLALALALATTAPARAALYTITAKTPDNWAAQITLETNGATGQVSTFSSWRIDFTAPFGTWSMSPWDGASYLFATLHVSATKAWLDLTPGSGDYIYANGAAALSIFPPNTPNNAGSSTFIGMWAPNYTAWSTVESTATQLVSAVPEPATWSVLLAGCGLIGAARRRSRSARASQALSPA